MSTTPKGQYYELLMTWPGGTAEVRDKRHVTDIGVARNHLRFWRLARKLAKIHDRPVRNGWFIRRAA